MEMHLFTVYDSAAGAFLEPFVAASVASAMRGFRDVVNKAGHQFNKYAEDYTLFYVGTFDQKSGHLLPIEPTSLGVALSFRKTEVDHGA